MMASLNSGHTELAPEERPSSGHFILPSSRAPMKHPGWKNDRPEENAMTTSGS
jgi:hypothetical protein